MKVEILLPTKLFEPTKYKLLEDFKYKDIVVPKGFITDGASVPRIFWCLFPPTGRYFIAAVIHDYLLENDFCWKKANKEFKEALLYHSLNKIVVFILYSSVNIYQFFKHVIFRNPSNRCKK